MNMWGRQVRHSVVSADPVATGARSAIAPEVDCDFPDGVPSLKGAPGPVRYFRLARFMRRFDLILTYNWGAMDAVMAHRMFSPFMRLPPLVHHEDGFNADEAQRLYPRRNLFRRLALRSAHALVVPSKRLHDIARARWRQAEHRIRLIANGIDVEAYGKAPEPGAIPGFERLSGKVVIGTLAGLRPVKNLRRLVRAVAPLGDAVQLVIVGEGPERDAILAQASALGVRGLVMPGFLPDPWKYIGNFDIFALSSDSEQTPVSLIEAMAAGLPVAATDVGDVASMLSPDNAPFIVPATDEHRFADALAQLARNATLRAKLGEANRRRAGGLFREDAMIEQYAALYNDAMKSKFTVPEAGNG